MRVIIGTWGKRFVKDDPEAVYIDFAIDWNRRGQVSRRIYRGGKCAHLSLSEFAFASSLLACRGGMLTLADLVMVFYGDREDGGPDDPLRVVDQIRLRVRRKLAPLGIAFVSRWRQGVSTELVDPFDYVPHEKHQRNVKRGYRQRRNRHGPNDSRPVDQRQVDRLR